MSNILCYLHSSREKSPFLRHYYFYPYFKAVCFDFVHLLGSIERYPLRVLPNTILSDVGISSFHVSPKTKGKNSRKSLVFIQKIKATESKIALKNSPINSLRAF